MVASFSLLDFKMPRKGMILMRIFVRFMALNALPSPYGKDYEEMDYLKLNFQQMGIATMNFWVNMGSLRNVLLFGLFITVISVVVTCLPLKNVSLTKIKKKLIYYFVFSFSIRMYTLIYLPLTLFAFINLYERNSGSFISVFWLIQASVMPLIILMIKKFFIRKFKLKNFNAKMGTLVEDFDLANKKIYFVWPIFFYRRFIFAMTLVVFRNNIALQIVINVLVAVFIFLFIFKFKFFKMDVQNLLEMFNEGNNILMLILSAIFATREKND